MDIEQGAHFLERIDVSTNAKDIETWVRRDRVQLTELRWVHGWMLIQSVTEMSSSKAKILGKMEVSSYIKHQFMIY